MNPYEYPCLADKDCFAVIFRGIVGSRAYGTANANSDTDVRGIFIVPSKSYVRLTPPPKQVSDERNDHTYYYDAKNMMHLTRLLFSSENIVKNGEPIVRFEGKKLQTLLSIRRGEWTFEAIMDQAETIRSEIESGKSRLRAVPDREKIDGLISEVMKMAGVA